MSAHTSLETYRADFDALAEQYDKLPTARMYDDLVLSALPRDPQLVLDLGCGTGVLTRKLAEHAHRVIGFDISPQMLELATRRDLRPNVEFRLAPLESVPDLFAPGVVDAIVACRSLHHCQSLAKTVSGLARLLKPAGRLVILDLTYTGAVLRPATRRFLQLCHKVSLLLKSLACGRLPAVMKALAAEDRFMALPVWRQHLRHEPSFNWKFLCHALREADLRVSPRKLDCKFCFILALPQHRSR